MEKDLSKLRKKNILHLENVYKSYGPKSILDDIDLSVAKGELCTVVGPSGCGKSTLLRIIVGQERATSGEVLLEGEHVGYPDPVRGIVYQRYSLFPHMSVIDNVLLGVRLQTSLRDWWRSKKQHREEALHYLEKVRLADHSEKFPHELSGGMQQRVAIAQTLICRPKIVLMDEPFGALDSSTRENIQVFLLQLWEELKMTVFFVTHDLEEAVFLGTRILVLSQHYRDERGTDPKVDRGAKIVGDHQLPRVALSTAIKRDEKFRALVKEIRKAGFDPEVRRHVKEFNLKHPDSFQTLTSEESGNGEPAAIEPSSSS